MSKNINPNSENPSRKSKKVKHILIGSPEEVKKTIYAIYALKYAYPGAIR
ncbi:MAG: hypothetical protein F6K26_53535 [Moorea sp. SIO2I5]|nr:hypothetical protein [Moorena sp. SIO2I5]